jgi:autotransporter translocation and assembly factor TamB
VKRAAIILLRAVLALITLVLLLAAFSQTQFFRDRLRSLALSNLQKVLNADIYLGELRGNLFAGFVLDSLSLTVDGRTLLATDSVEFRYDVLTLPGRTISLGSITLVRPTVQLLRTQTGEWNFTRLFRPAGPDSAATDTAAASWRVVLEGLEILDGVVHLVDSSWILEHPEEPGFIDYQNFTLRGLHLAMAGRLGPEEKRVEIKQFSFAVDSPPFRLRSLSARARLTATETEVSDLHIVTDGSDLTLSATLGKTDLLGGISLTALQHAPLTASLRIGALDFRELRRLLPPVDFLDGEVSGELSARGEFGQLEVKGLDLRHGKTALALRGTVSNLHRPADLALDLRMDENTIDPADLARLLPGLDLPDFSGVGLARLSARFKGTPLDFTASLQVDAEGGQLQVPGLSLTIGGPRMLAYQGEATFRNVDLAAITGTPSLKSHLTGSVVARGEGIDLRKMSGSFEIRLDSSKYRDEPITDAWLSVGARERRVLGRLQATVGRTRAELTGMLDESAGPVPAFTLNGTVTGLDLQDLFNDPEFESNITVALDARGVGLNWQDLDGTLLLDFANSRYRGTSIDSGYVQVTVTGTDSLRKMITVGSPVLDVVVDGVVDPSGVARLLSYQVQNIRRELGRKLASIDSSLQLAVDTLELARIDRELARSGKSPDAEFTLQLKNLEPLASVLGGPRFVGTGFVAGEIRGQGQELTLHSRLQLDEFAYGNDREGGVFIEGADVLLEVRRLTRNQPLETMDFHCGGRIDHLAINRASFDSLTADIEYRESEARFSLGISGDERSFRLDSDGNVRLLQDSLSLQLTRCDAAFESYRWGGKADLVLTGSGLQLRDALFVRGDERLEARGFLGSGRRFEATLRAGNLDLDFLKYLLPPERPGVRRAFFAGRADAQLVASGMLSDPEYAASVKLRDVLVREMPLGTITAELHYRQQALTGHLESTTAGSGGTPQLRIDGRVPANLALSGVEGKRFPDEPVSLTIRGDRFQLAVLDPFLPAFDDFAGLMDCDLKLEGTFRDPLYEGTMTVREGSFLFEPNNIAYEFDGEFRAVGRRLQVVRTGVRNIAADVRGGRRGAVTITGDLALKNFRPGDFNLAITGNLLVVKESTQRSTLEVSGELFAEIERAGLHFTGEIEHSLLRGAVNIRNSTLVFPPGQAQVNEESATSVPVVWVDDTTRVTARKRRAAEQYFTSRSAPGDEVRGEEETPTVSFMDGLRYDLDIETGGGTSTIEMIFNPLTAEKLVATINGRFAIRGEKSRWYGDLTISQAYYNFLKRFDAEGTIRFTGDFMNPELDITATYQNRRTNQDSTGRTDEKVVVIFEISGTKREPQIATKMKIDDVDYANYSGLKSNDVQSDAIQFIVYGTFPLTLAQRNEANSDLQKQIGASALTGAASMLTGALSEFLRTQTGFINSVDIRYSADSAPEIRLSGSALKGYWRFGGRFVDEPLANADFSLLYSMESIFGEPSLRNLMFEFERRVESSSLQATDFKRVNSARLFYRFSF